MVKLKHLNSETKEMLKGIRVSQELVLFELFHVKDWKTVLRDWSHYTLTETDIEDFKKISSNVKEIKAIIRELSFTSTCFLLKLYF